MIITEIEQFSLADAVKFHDRLNPRLWQDNEHLLPLVHQHLLRIAKDFIEFLGVSDLDVTDITVSGSNAAYSYTPSSDIDLHVIVRMPSVNAEVYQELFDAKKYQYNDQHDITVGGSEVELYVQPSDQPHHSQGIYSLITDQWLRVPSRRPAKIDDDCVQLKTQDLMARIQQVIRSQDQDRMQRLWKKIKNMRQAGLNRTGEFGCENLVFKLLRNSGLIQQLVQAKTQTHDRNLSLSERGRKRRKPVRYGFATWYAPGSSEHSDSSGEGMAEGHQGSSLSSPDGVSASTEMFLNERDSDDQIIADFVQAASKKLALKQTPRLIIHRDEQWASDNQSFGLYEPESRTLHVNQNGRHIMDVLRTIAHELVHCRQHELAPMPPSSGQTGSAWENQAHATAGVLMRQWADQYPDLFQGQVFGEASGYIPTAKQQHDPRFKTALTTDIRPGQTGREANKLNLGTDAQGRAQLLRASVNLREHKVNDLNDPLGPETPPTMPRGTVRVDVSDMYDWYKLGRDFANLDRANAATYGKGPPSTIVSFGDEDTEHLYIKDLEQLGLTTTDIDPVDPDQPADMPRQKTDPTFNVAEDDIVESLRREFAILENEFLGEINMSPSSLQQQASKIDARVGMEFEMIVPNVDTDDMAEMEPDYGPDERVRGWQSIENFFLDDDHNSPESIQRLHDELFKEYTESEHWVEAEQSWWEENEEYYVEQAIEKELGEELWQEAADQLGDRKFADERDRKNAIQEIYSTLLADRRDDCINDRDEIYDLARDDAMEESEPDHETGFTRFLRASYSYMTDIETSFSHIVTWPYWESVGDADADVSQVANDFSAYVNMKVDYSQSYHGAKRKPDAYVVEPDSSLDGDNPGDTGLEFVSPPLTLAQMTQHLEAVKQYAKDYNCYTNRSTGLHINVSVPDMSLDNLDYVKLALLLGDKYVLEQFGRSANTYCKSAMDEILSRARSNRDQVPGLLDMMKAGLNKMAGKMIHSGSTAKYISINNKEKYIEFRSPGGDWLNTDLDKIVNTMNRFVVTLDAAVDPEKYKEEYSKKLYKIIAPADASDTIKYFARYAAGEIPKAALKSFLKQAKLEREVNKKPDDGKLYYWNVTVPGSSASLQVVAANRNDAWTKAIGLEGYPEWGRRFDAAAATIQVIKPYTGDLTPGNETPQDDQRDSPVGKYEVVSSEGRTLETYTAGSYQEALARMNREWESSIRFGSPVTLRPVMGPGGGTASQTSRSRRTDGSLTAPESMPDANYAIIRVADNDPIRYFTASTQQEAEQEYARWRQHTGAWEVEFYLISINPRNSQDAQPQPERRLDGSMTAPESDPDANFAVIRSSDNAVINYFTRNTRQEAEDAFTRWLSAQGLAASLIRNSPSAPYYLIAIRPRSAPESRAEHGFWTGRWNIVTDQNQVIHTFGGVRTQADANAHARQWLERNSRYAQLGLTVVPDRIV